MESHTLRLDVLIISQGCCNVLGEQTAIMMIEQ